MKKIIITLVGSAILITLGYSNCSKMESMKYEAVSETTGLSTDTPPAADDIGEKAMAVLATNCNSCHGAGSNVGGISNISDLPSLLTTVYAPTGKNMVKPGDALNSQIYDSVASGRMPTAPLPLLSDTDLTLLRDWINSGALAPGVTTPVVVPPVILAATFESISKNILVPKCVACHGPDVAESEVRYDTYAFTNRTTNNGKLLESIDPIDGTMPEGLPKLSAAEFKVISDWVALGAPNN